MKGRNKGIFGTVFILAAAILGVSGARAIEVELASGSKMEADRVEFDGTRFQVHAGAQVLPLRPEQVKFMRADEAASHEVERLKGELKAARAETEKLREEKLAASSTSVSQQQLGARLRQATEQIGKLEGELKQAKARMAELESAAGETEKAASAKDQALAAVRKELAETQRQLKDAQEAGKRLEARVAELSAPPLADDLKIDEVTQVPAKTDGLVAMSARLVNSGKTTFRTVIVQGALLDAEGKTVATASTYAADLRPGDTRTVKMDAPADAAKVAKAEVTVAETFPATATSEAGQ